MYILKFKSPPKGYRGWHLVFSKEDTNRLLENIDKYEKCSFRIGLSENGNENVTGCRSDVENLSINKTIFQKVEGISGMKIDDLNLCIDLSDEDLQILIDELKRCIRDGDEGAIYIATDKFWIWIYG